MWVPTSQVDEVWGRLKVTVGGTDITFLRDSPVLVQSISSGDPFGDLSAVVKVPQITPFEALPSWCKAGAVGVISVVRPGGAVKHLFQGVLVSPEDNAEEKSSDLTLQFKGILVSGDLGLQQPSFQYQERDIGFVISETFNNYPGRRYAKCQPVLTGIKTRQRGSWTGRITGFVQDLLGTATVANGSNQWTVKQAGRTPVIALKDRTTVHATISIADGIVLALASDATGAPNVIYGEGISPDHRRWRNTKYPNLHPDTAPVYPLAAGQVFSPGSSTIGFGKFATEMREHGYNTIVSGDTYDAADEDEVRDAQKRAGIQVDGIVGPQTWAAIFETGSNTGDLSGAYFAPLAYDTRVEPYRYNARGARIGKNPSYDPSVLRVERYENFGENVTKQQAILSARAELKRVADAGHQGTLTLTADPQEMHRFELRAGMNIKVKKHRGVDRLLHIAGVRIDFTTGSVELTVDDKARDLLTLGAIRSRNTDAATDPVRRSLPQRRASRLAMDDAVIFDSESGAGITPDHAQYEGLWSVLHIPAGQLGNISRTEFTSHSPASAFAVGIFGKPITSADLVRLVGNPFAGTKPWSVEADALVDAGIMMAWGGPGQAMGFYPLAESDPSAPATGRFVDGSGWFYESSIPPWLWVAIYTVNSCFVKGRLYGGQDF